MVVMKWKDEVSVGGFHISWLSSETVQTSKCFLINNDCFFRTGSYMNYLIPSLINMHSVYQITKFLMMITDMWNILSAGKVIISRFSNC